MSDTTITDLMAVLSPESTEESHEEETRDEEQDHADNEDSDYSDEDSTGEDSEEDDDDSTDAEDSDEDYEDDEDDGSQRKSFDEDDFTITVDGEEVTVKGSELKNGYMRQSAFTKKTQELAEERKALTTEKEAVVKQASLVAFQAHSKMEQFEEAVRQSGGWENIRKTYAPEQVEQFTQLFVAAQQEARAADELIEEYETSIHESNKQALTSIFSNMAQTIDGFNQDSLNEMESYLSDNGFTKEMVYGMTHGPAWEMIYKAMKYDKAQMRSKEAKESGTKDKVKNKRHHETVSKPVKTDSKSRKVNKAIEAQKKNKGDSKSTEDALIALFGGKK